MSCGYFMISCPGRSAALLRCAAEPGPMQRARASRWVPVLRSGTSRRIAPGTRSASHPSPRQPALQAHHIADDFGNRMIVLDRDFVVDLHCGMQGAGQGDVLDDGNIVRFRDFPDLERDGVDALGDAD